MNDHAGRKSASGQEMESNEFSWSGLMLFLCGPVTATPSSDLSTLMVWPSDSWFQGYSHGLTVKCKFHTAAHSNSRFPHCKAEL